MREYYLADVVKHGDEFEITAPPQAGISYQQYRQINSWFNYAGFYQTCRSIKNMTLESADDLEAYLRSLCQREEAHDRPEIDQCFTTGNKLFISFLSFIKTFIDVVSNAISRRSPPDLKGFQEMNSRLYDSFFGYRFFTRMRNYVIHYDMPLTTITDSVSSGISMRCGRENLLRFEKWNTLRGEIERLPEEIDILPYLAEARAAVFALYLHALTVVADQAIEGYQSYQRLCGERGLSSPLFLILDEDADAPKMEQLPLHLVRDFFTDLNEHPNYTVTFLS